MKSKQKLVKPNRLVQAKQETKEMKLVEIPTEIREDEAHLMHLCLIKTEARPESRSFVDIPKFQKIHIEAWLKNEKQFRYLGYEKIVIFNDPRIEAEDVIDVDVETGADITFELSYAESKEKAFELGFVGPKNLSHEVYNDFILNSKEQ